MIKSTIFETLNAYDIEICEQTGKLVNALYTTAMYEGSVSTVYHSKGNIDWRKKIIAIEKALDSENIIAIESYNKFSKLTLRTSWIIGLIGEDAWREERIAYKVRSMRLPTKVGKFVGTKVHGKLADTGLKRPGFERTLASTFSFDRNMLIKYERPIIMNIFKSLDKIQDKALKQALLDDPVSYWEICRMLVREYAHSTQAHTQGDLALDQRGRAILEAIRYAFSPITNKDARASIVIPARAISTRNYKAIESIYLFIAELIGNKTTNISEKIEEGERCYHEGVLPKLKLFKASDRKELHELIWLERIYKQLDILFDKGTVYWDIPLEIDFTASMMAIDGIILGSRPHMNATNTINDDDLQDAWYAEGINRLKLKFAMTPTLYGSSETYRNLIEHRGETITDKELAKLTKFCKASSLFKVSTKFKDLIIKNARMKPIMNIKIGKDQFTIKCTKFKKQGADVEKTVVYEPKSGENRVVSTHTPKLVPDLKQFKLFSKTLLNHNLDSQILDEAILEAYYQYIEWCIAIHDAALLHPLDTDILRTSVRSVVKRYYANRETILREFCASIGIIYDKTMAKFIDSIEQVSPEDQFSKYAMK